MLASVRGLLGAAWARIQRHKRIPHHPEFLPPQLRSHPRAEDFALPDSLTARVPVTLYWGAERNVDLSGGPKGIPRWLGYFDWVVGFEYGWADVEQFPASVYCEPTYLPALLSYLQKRWPDGHPGPALLASGAGPDYLLSWQRRRVLEGLRRYFTCIYYEAKDIEVEGVAKLRPR